MTDQRRVEPDWDDVQGHGKEADVEATEGDDTEGHKIGNSDRNIKVDVHPVEHEHVHEYIEDVEGHSICTRCSDQNIKVDVHPVEHDDDVEGHRTSY